MRRFLLVSVSIILAALTIMVACTTLISPPEGGGFEGVVEVKSDTLLPAENPFPEILILDEDRPEENCRRMIHAIKETTRVGFARPDGLARRASPEDIEVGARVRAWADGGCTFGCPGVCISAWILILDEN